MSRWLVWNILFRFQERIKGHDTFRILHEMESADRLSADELRVLQTGRLRDLLRYCQTHIPWIGARMAEAGLKPDSVREPEDIRRLPLMTKADVRMHRDELRSSSARRLAAFSTGGSTGEPLIFDIGKRRVAARVACRQRVARWWGLSVGDPEIALWGSPVELTRQDWLRSIRDRLMTTRLLSAFEMDEPTMSRYLEVLTSSPCRQIFGYPSALYLLCRHAKNVGRDLRSVGIKAAFVTGEVLYPYQRELISETLGCPVADGYGGRDSGFISHECPQGGMHVLADAVLVELIGDDGEPAPPGEPGQIVVTDLYSHEAPFVRYATGDMAVWSSRRCQCGRGLPLFERIEGRANDSVVAPDGRVINSLALIYPVREVDGIEQFRVRQKAVDRFHVQIVRNGRYNVEGEALIRAGWTRLLRSPLQITFEYVPSLPAEGSGKFRHVISDVPLARAAAAMH